MKRKIVAISSIIAFNNLYAQPFPDVYFEHKNQTAHYWNAFVLSAKGDKQEAQTILHSLKENSYSSELPEFIQKPRTLQMIGDAYFVAQFAHNPQLMSTIGVFESVGFKEHNEYLTNVSPAYIEKVHNHQKDILQWLDVIERKPEEQLEYLFIKWLRDSLHESTPFLFHEYQLTQMFGVVHNLMYVLTDDHRFEEKNDVDRYISRLTKIPQQIQQVIKLIQYQKEASIIPPQFALEKTINMIDSLMPKQAEEHILYTHLAKQFEKIKRDDSVECLNKTKNILITQIYPVFELLKKSCLELLSSSHVQGVWALPNGDAYYRYCLKKHTTTDLIPQEIHEIGCAQVEQVQNSIKKILDSLNISTTEDNLPEKLNDGLDQPEFYYENTPEGRSACLKDLTQIWQRCCTQLYPLFSTKPSSHVKIKAVPVELQEGAPLAYYGSPSVDGVRPGEFYINLRDMREVNKCHLETLVIHEAEPGHHFQVALQLENDFSLIQKFNDFTAYCEGWALYCERLGSEQKFYSSPFNELGHLQWELLRSARLVADTGIHYKRWSYDQAVEYMIKTTGMKKENMITEVERYFVFPGQACAYKIGQLKLLQLRDKMQHALQDKFSIRDFHDIVLTTGSVPLPLLEDVVDAYITRKISLN